VTPPARAVEIGRAASKKSSQVSRKFSKKYQRLIEISSFFGMDLRGLSGRPGFFGVDQSSVGWQILILQSK
jgi:hypothetical protein